MYKITNKQSSVNESNRHCVYDEHKYTGRRDSKTSHPDSSEFALEQTTGVFFKCKPKHNDKLLITFEFDMLC